MITEEAINNFLSHELCGITTHFVIKNFNTNVKITNVHPSYQEKFSRIETAIEQQLTIKAENELAIVVGDFNHSLDQHQKNQNSTTSVSPKAFSKKTPKIQGAYSIDGGFYTAYDKKNTKKNKQAIIQIVDPITGKVLEKNALTSLTPKHPSQKEEVSELRPVLLIDDETKATDFFVNDNQKQKFSDIEQKLTSFGTGKEPCKLRVARDINGTPGVAVEVSTNTYEKLSFLQGAFENEWGYFITAKGEPGSKKLCEFKEFMVKMHTIIENANTNIHSDEAKIMDFAKTLHVLSVNRKQMNKPEQQEFVQSLKLVLEEICKEYTFKANNKNDKQKNKQLLTVAQHFEKVIHDIHDKSLFEQYQKQSQKELDRKLFSKPPLSPKMKMLVVGVFAVLGAVVAAVIGALIVGAVTALPTGGVGAIPGAALGAVKGAALGYQIGSAVGLACIGFFGALGGYHKGKSNTKQYNSTQENLKKSEWFKSTERVHKIFI